MVKLKPKSRTTAVDFGLTGGGVLSFAATGGGVALGTAARGDLLLLCLIDAPMTGRFESFFLSSFWKALARLGCGLRDHEGHRRE